MIKYLDLQKLNKPFEQEFQNKLQEFLSSGRYILGPSVEKFEREFAEYCGADFCIGTANGLDALTLILKAEIKLGRLTEGDKVLVPGNTFIATILSVTNAGLQPVLADVDYRSFNLNLSVIKKQLTRDIKAIILVHLYGQLVSDIESIVDYCSKKGVLVYEDAAQAHGAYNHPDKRSGAFAKAAAFSFYPTKNLGALGDGGAITTNDEEIAKTVKLLRNYGSSKTYFFDEIGINSRLDEVQALFLSLKLKTLDSQNEIRQNLAKRYIENILNEKILLPIYSGKRDHVFYAFVVMVEDRENFLLYLRNNEIQVNVHYPIPPHEQPALKNKLNVNLPITEKIHKSVVSLPLNPTLSDIEINKIISVLNRY